MGTKTETEAQKSPYPLLISSESYSFELNQDLLNRLREESDPAEVVARFARAVGGKKGAESDSVAEKLFGEYGQSWMKKTLQLGEEYPDRTYEVIREAADQTGELVFPLILQRFIEIAYLGTQQFRKLPVVENWARRLVYKVTDCYTFNLLKEKCAPEVVALLPCRHACLAAGNTACRELNLEATTTMDASMVKDGCCRFVITRK
jgi:hypothetical protein